MARGTSASEIENPVKRLFMTVSQGVYVVGVAEAGLTNAFTASAVMEVSMQPPMLALAINPHNASYGLLIEGGIFALTVLGDDQRVLADFFGNQSARDLDKLARVRWHAAPSGAPVLDEGVAYLDCRVVSKSPAGDHIVILAEVTGGEFLQAYRRPLLYSDLGDMDGSASRLPWHLETGP